MTGTAITTRSDSSRGPGDNFSLQSSHVLPALIRRFNTAAKSGAADVEIRGTGTPRREFLHADDLAVRQTLAWYRENHCG